ncbi:hypothetical protein GCM10025864_40080 [Luteimicrobium album]|uniref:Uncharacterized protein n=1 Tax=Luteimicrobium album TaxID=1054550 RepID=A0ABQ6I8C7_9MICO|nr:hypothetical protein GCM10025864_40080 [Luteimicrobium album]
MTIQAAFDVPAERGTALNAPAPRTGAPAGDRELEVGWFRAPADGGVAGGPPGRTPSMP